MILLHADKKSGKQYLLDKSTSSIYLYYPQFASFPTKTVAIFIAIMTIIWVLSGISNMENLRPLFHMDYIERVGRIIIVTAAIFVQVLLVMFHKRNFTERYVGHKTEIELSDEEKAVLYKKSLSFCCFAILICLGVGALTIIPIAIYFIRHGNITMYLWILFLSSIFVRYPVTLIKFFLIPVIQVWLAIKSPH